MVPVGLTHLKSSSKPIFCPSCGRTCKTEAVVSEEDGKKASPAEGLAIAAICAICSLGLFSCLLLVELRRFLSASTLHYCGHCGLRLAFYNASADDNHVLVNSYLDWLASPQGKRRLLVVASPFGRILPDATNMRMRTESRLGGVASDSHANTHLDFEVFPFHGPSSLPTVLLRGTDGSSVWVADGGTARFMPYRPDDRGPEAVWHINAPHARVYFRSRHGVEDEYGEEIARVRFWRRQPKVEFYLSEQNTESSAAGRRDWGPGVTGHTVIPIDGLGLEVASSMGQLLWTHRVMRGATTEDPNVKSTRQLLLLDAYDRVVASEVTTSSGRLLRMFGNLTARFVEEIATSYAASMMQNQRLDEYEIRPASPVV